MRLENPQEYLALTLHIVFMRVLPDINPLPGIGIPEFLSVEVPTATAD